MSIFDEQNPQEKPELKPEFDMYTATTGITGKTFGAEFNVKTNLTGLKISAVSECTVLPAEAKVSFGAGVDWSPNGKTTITPGLESSLSLQNGNTKTHVLLPTLKITQDVGKNTKLITSAQPFRRAPIQLGVQFNF